MQAAALDILIVDDQPVFRMLLAETLRAAGCETIREAENPLDAQAVLAQRRADVLLIDKSMPGCDGITFIADLRADPAHARAAMILITGFADSAIVEKARAAGADAVLGKPIEVEKLFAAIEGALGARAA